MSRAATNDCDVRWIANAVATDAAPGSRDDLRAKIGASPRDLVVTPIATGPNAIKGRDAIFNAGILEILGQPAMIVLHRDTPRIDAGIRLRDVTGVGLSIQVVDEPVPSLWPAVDVVFEIAGEPSPLDDDRYAADIRAWADRCNVKLRRAIHSGPSRDPIPPMLDTLWWAADMPGAVREEPHA
ncbi:MAG: hypothetical protein CMJ31_14295 [Phycisphaerae bacterium]|nr:hypothetical protein [Phycisphaerae bacterium]